MSTEHEIPTDRQIVQEYLDLRDRRTALKEEKKNLIARGKKIEREDTDILIEMSKRRAVAAKYLDLPAPSSVPIDVGF